MARTFDHAGEFRMGLINLTLKDIEQPLAPNVNAGFADTEMYKIRLKQYADNVRHRNTNMQRIFPLILGQCSRTIRDRIEASPEWDGINGGSDVIRLLRLIRRSIYNRSTSRKTTHAFSEAEQAFMCFKQTDKMSNSDYLEKFKSLAEVYEHVGGQLGVTEERILEFLEDPDANDPDDCLAAIRRAREE